MVQCVITSPEVDSRALQSPQIPTLPLPSIADLKPGPFYLDIGPTCFAVREVYRLYQDVLRAFTQGVTPLPGSTDSSTSSIFDADTENLVVPLPSRIYYLGNPRFLSGVRVAVKGLYFLDGIKAGASSRVCLEMCPENNLTCPSVAKLLDLGAAAVVTFRMPIFHTPAFPPSFRGYYHGLLRPGQEIIKTSQFTNGMESWEWGDFKYLRNPRGYDWLSVAYSLSGSGVPPSLDTTSSTSPRGDRQQLRHPAHA